MATQPVSIGYYSYNNGMPNYSFTPFNYQTSSQLQPNLYTVPLNSGFSNYVPNLNDSSVQVMPLAAPTLMYSTPFPLESQPEPEPDPEQGQYYFYHGGDINSSSNNQEFYSQSQHPCQPFFPSMEPIHESATLYPQEHFHDDDGYHYYFGGGNNFEVSNFQMIENLAPTPLTYFGTPYPQAPAAPDLYPQYLTQPWEAPAEQYFTWLCPVSTFSTPYEADAIYGMEGFPEPLPTVEEPLEWPVPEGPTLFGQEYSEATGNELKTGAGSIIDNLWTSHPVANLHDYSATTILVSPAASETTQNRGPAPRLIKSGRWEGLSKEMDTFSRSRIGCKFCLKAPETRAWYGSHRLKDEQGRVECPVLRKYVCQLCKKTGGEAHTLKFCPMYRNGYYRLKENNSKKKSCHQRQME